VRELQELVDAMKIKLPHQRVLHADETPVAMLDPGAGKTHRAYRWTCCSTSLQPTKLVVFDFDESRASRHPAEFLGHPGEDAWHGTLVCDGCQPSRPAASASCCRIAGSRATPKTDLLIPPGQDGITGLM